jgi:uncharacterized protein (DUF4415 family)
MSQSLKSTTPSSRLSSPGGVKKSASSRPAEHETKSVAAPESYSNPDGERVASDIDWARLHAMTEEEIEAAARADPDWEGLLDLEGWTATVVVPPKKAPISIRLDEDVLAFFKASGPGYQKRINAVLRAFMEAAATRSGTDRA